jgi:hypothetical protein
MLQGSDEAVMEQDGGRRGAVLCAEVGRRLEVAVLEQWRLEPSAARRHACEEERERRCSRDCVGYVGLGPYWVCWGARAMRDEGDDVPRGRVDDGTRSHFLSSRDYVH